MPYWFNMGLSQSMYVLFIRFGLRFSNRLHSGHGPFLHHHHLLPGREPKDRVTEFPRPECDGRRSAILLILLTYPPSLEQPECHQSGARRRNLNQPYCLVLRQHDS